MPTGQNRAGIGGFEANARSSLLRGYLSEWVYGQLGPRKGAGRYHSRSNLTACGPGVLVLPSGHETNSPHIGRVGRGVYGFNVDRARTTASLLWVFWLY